MWIDLLLIDRLDLLGGKLDYWAFFVVDWMKIFTVGFSFEIPCRVKVN